MLTVPRLQSHSNADQYRATMPPRIPPMRRRRAHEMSTIPEHLPAAEKVLGMRPSARI